MEGLRIVLLGKRGAGKSSAGNTLLGSRPFYTAASSQGATQGCSMSTSTVDGHKICVVDTPGWTDLSQMEDETVLEFGKCIDLTHPGPHVFLLVLPIGRFTKEEIETAKQILEFFGKEEASKYAMVLFTKGDDLEEKTIEGYMKDVQTDLEKILDVCGGRYHVFNNREKENRKQVSDLLEKIKLMVERNKGKHYTRGMYQKAAEQMEGKRKRQKIMTAVMEEACRKLMNNSEVGSNDDEEIRNHGSDTTGKVSEKRKEGEHKPCSEDREGESQRMAVKQNQEMKSCCKEDSDQGDEYLEEGELSQSRAEKSENLSEELYKLKKFIEKIEKRWLKEKGELEAKIQQQEINQKNELVNVKTELQQLKGEVYALEKPRQEYERQREKIKRLRSKKKKKRRENEAGHCTNKAF